MPARNRLVDDLLLAALQQQSSSHPAVQVVNIGCGMVGGDTTHTSNSGQTCADMLMRQSAPKSCLHPLLDRTASPGGCTCPATSTGLMSTSPASSRQSSRALTKQALPPCQHSSSSNRNTKVPTSKTAAQEQVFRQHSFPCWFTAGNPCPLTSPRCPCPAA